MWRGQAWGAPSLGGAAPPGRAPQPKAKGGRGAKQKTTNKKWSETIETRGGACLPARRVLRIAEASPGHPGLGTHAPQRQCLAEGGVGCGKGGGVSACARCCWWRWCVGVRMRVRVRWCCFGGGGGVVWGVGDQPGLGVGLEPGLGSETGATAPLEPRPSAGSAATPTHTAGASRTSRVSRVNPRLLPGASQPPTPSGAASVQSHRPGPPTRVCLAQRRQELSLEVDHLRLAGDGGAASAPVGTRRGARRVHTETRRYRPLPAPPKITHAPDRVRLCAPSYPPTHTLHRPGAAAGSPPHTHTHTWCCGWK